MLHWGMEALAGTSHSPRGCSMKQLCSSLFHVFAFDLWNVSACCLLIVRAGWQRASWTAWHATTSLPGGTSAF